MKASRLSISALLSLVSAFAAPIQAHTGDSFTNVIHACVSHIGLVRIVGPEGKCFRFEHPIHWDITGPAGPGAQTGAVRGHVLSCTGNTADALAHIPGRSFMARTDSQGLFELSNVPTGTHTVAVEPEGQPPRFITGVNVAASQTSDVGDILVTDLANDPRNCGTCGNVCGLGAACVAGQCGAGTTCSDQDGDGYFAAAGCGTPVDCNDTNANTYPGQSLFFACPLNAGLEYDFNCDGIVTVVTPPLGPTVCK